MSEVTGRTKEKIVEVVQRMSEERARAVLEFAQFLSEREGWEATWEILRDPGMMEELRAGEEDVGAGRLHRWEGSDLRPCG